MYIRVCTYPSGGVEVCLGRRGSYLPKRLGREILRSCHYKLYYSALRASSDFLTSF